MWDNPPPEVAALRTMLVASPTWAALAGSAKTDNIHYPSVAVGDSVTPAPEPSILIEPSADEDDVLAPGVALPNGILVCVLRQKEVNAAAIETTARAIANEVVTQMVGLPLSGRKVGLCSKPDPASLAAQQRSDNQLLGLIVATRTIPIIFTYRIG